MHAAGGQAPADGSGESGMEDVLVAIGYRHPNETQQLSGRVLGALGWEVAILGKACQPQVEIHNSQPNTPWVACGCFPNPRHVAMDDLSLIKCPHCGTLIARSGYRIVAANW